MFELILFAALIPATALPSQAPTLGAVPASTGIVWSTGDDATSPPALVDLMTISWRDSVEAASAGDLDTDTAGLHLATASDERMPDFASEDSAVIDGSYAAMLAKRWHWFELYGVSRLHIVPKESRHPWWFSY